MTSNPLFVPVLIRRFSLLAAALALFLGAAGNLHAASCQNALQGHLDWLSQTPSGYSRFLTLVMVSNQSPTFPTDSMSLPEVTYLVTGLKEGESWFKGTLTGVGGKAMFNNREWSDCTSLGCPQHPFDPKDTEDWWVVLKPSDSSMLLHRGSNPYNISLDCDAVMVGTYANGLKVAWSKTKYVLSFYRRQVVKIK